MRGVRIIGTGLALALALGVAVLAQGERPSGYLAAADLPDSLTIIGGPPDPRSVQAADERANFLATRVLAGTPRWAQATADNELFGDKAHVSLACAAGVTISRAATPTLSRLLDRVVIDAGTSVRAAKDRFMRDRPLIGYDDAPICIPREDWMKTNGSYPSGHAAAGWAWSLVMAELVPARATPILQRGRDFGDSRVVCGLHYPSDVAAGRTMGAATVARLHADPEFQKDLKKARAELAKAPPAGGCG